MDIALQVRKPKNYPFDGAANIKYPLVTVAALQFGARAYPAIVDGSRIVKAMVVGNDSGVPILDENGDPRTDPMNGEPLWQKKPGLKRAKADRVSQAHVLPAPQRNGGMGGRHRRSAASPADRGLCVPQGVALGDLGPQQVRDGPGDSSGGEQQMPVTG
jgi:hypothetical protein